MAKSKKATTKSQPGGKPDGSLPTRGTLLNFLETQIRPLTRSEIARGFGLKGAARTQFRELLREFEAAGDVERTQGRRYQLPGRLPPVTVIEMVGLDEDGEPIAIPTSWKGTGAAPQIAIRPRRGISAPSVGDRLLARIKRSDSGHYIADPIRRIEATRSDDDRGALIGVLRETADGIVLAPADRSLKRDFPVEKADLGGADIGDLVVAEALPDRGGNQTVKIAKRLAEQKDDHFLTRIAIEASGIPYLFPQAVLDEAAAFTGDAISEVGRSDLRHLPFVTIDGADARDFDDAVFAQPLPNGAAGKNFINKIINTKKAVDNNVKKYSNSTRYLASAEWHVAVAIADVSFYVRPGSSLDSEAERRGNSVYFPDMVVPMLPEHLSNDLCSLRPQEDRPVLVCHMHIGADGKLVGSRFERALIHSVARLTYEQVQMARDEGKPTGDEAWRREIPSLYGVFAALSAARRNRGTLDLDIPEYRPVIDDVGKIERIAATVRLDSHRLIEECMIAANVAAAQSLERRTAACMFRVHESPDPEGVEDLARLGRELKLRVFEDNGRADEKSRKPQKGSAKWFNGLKEAAPGPAERHLISLLTLRAQSRARYAPDNVGHFGLGLQSYAHFTSPIRRYSDLLVHRSLVASFELGDGGLPTGGGATFFDLGGKLSAAERRAMLAERDTLDRFKAEFLKDSRNRHFQAIVSGVARFGLFVTVNDLGADGLVPMSRLGADRFNLAPDGHSLVGQRGGGVYRIGQPVEVVLQEANPVTGSLLFEMVTRGRKGAKVSRRGRQGNRRRLGKR